MKIQENISIQLIRRTHLIDKLISYLLPNMYPCNYNSADHFVKGILDEIRWFLIDVEEFENVKKIDIENYILDYKYDELTDYFNERCIVLKNNNIQESIRRILREESKIPPLMLRRRMNEIPKYIRAAYEWLNVKAFDSFNEFIERVIFSTTRDFVSDYGTNDYDKNLKIRDELTPYISEIIYDGYLDEIKDYYHK